MLVPRPSSGILTVAIGCEESHHMLTEVATLQQAPNNFCFSQDFDIGKVYKKKITLINATYTINYCKLVGVEEHLRDFIHIE